MRYSAVTRIKICGITNSEDALFCSELGVDALGFIFTKVSPRYISPSKAKQIIKQLPPFIVKIGVFVDEKKEVVRKIGEELGLNVIQFHGKESPVFCDSFHPEFGVIKTFFPYRNKFLDNLKKCQSIIVLQVFRLVSRSLRSQRRSQPSNHH